MSRFSLTSAHTVGKFVSSCDCAPSPGVGMKGHCHIIFPKCLHTKGIREKSSEEHIPPIKVLIMRKAWTIRWKGHCYTGEKKKEFIQECVE
jgi:hypothetical protein